ncbi:DUF4254 domain-containing protein [candidate division KSB1 bacterium]|nr:DUF4254 domain-containing protein [candidate division KSB1 bacterium]
MSKCLKQKLAADSVIRKCDVWTAEWHQKQPELASQARNDDEFFRWVHYNNFLLWHTEDEARRQDVPDAYIVRCKRDIDIYNQQRNDGIEKIDRAIDRDLFEMQIVAPKELPSNSETPASIVDRLSILCLKIYHMREETLRTDVKDAHVQKAREKLAILFEQRNDLGKALDDLIDAIYSGKKRHKLYYQFKMYNDPETNQAIYKR